MKNNKVVIIVGANGLIGRNICTSLIKNNFKVIGVDYSFPANKSKILNFKKQKQINYRLDVSKPNEVEEFLKLINIF